VYSLHDSRIDSDVTDVFCDKRTLAFVVCRVHCRHKGTGRSIPPAAGGHIVALMMRRGG